MSKSFTPDRKQLMCRYSDVVHSILTDTSKCTLTSFEVTSTSMFPSLHRGDTVVVSRAVINEVRRGDIVVAGTQGNYFVHRVIRRLRRGVNSAIQTKGDLSTFADCPIQEKHLIGIVEGIYRNGRYIDVGRPLMRLAGSLFTMLGFAQIAVQSLVRPF